MTHIPLFSELPLVPEVQAALAQLGFTQPTEIQSKAIPLLLAQSSVDFHGQAQTGTGKTLAFGIPLLHRIDVNSRTPQALVVAPTRELALQICDSLKPLAASLSISITTIYGGASMEDQVRTLKRGVHIVVGTPGRINDHLRRGTLNLGSIKTLVLDEADIMLDMGFKDEVDEILQETPESREIWLFSATVKPGINAIMRDHMHDTQSVRVMKKDNATTSASTKQYYVVVPGRQRLDALCRFIENAPEFYGFIFCQTKILAGEIAEQLIRLGYDVAALHGDLSQAQRNMVIRKFKNKEIDIVVATDVAARGIDVANLTHVVNYSLPEDHESYVHRIGRTGRAGKEGVAITFVSKGDLRALSQLQKKFNVTIEPLDVPSKQELIESRLVKARMHVQELLENAPRTIASLDLMIQELSDVERIKLLQGLLYNMFIKQIDKQEEVAFTPSVLTAGTTQQSNVQEISLPVGLDDGITREEVIEHIVNHKAATADQLVKVRVIKRKTFIDIDPAIAAQFVQALDKTTLAGRTVRCTLVSAQDDQRSSSGRGSRDGGYSRSRRSEGGRREGGRREGGRGFGSQGSSRGGRRTRYEA